MRLHRATCFILLTLMGFFIVINHFSNIFCVSKKKPHTPTFFERNCTSEDAFNKSLKVTFSYSPNMGLGNRLFLYASIYGISRRIHKCPYVANRPSFPPIRQFNLSMPIYDHKLKSSHIMESGCCKEDERIYKEINNTKQLVIHGWLQSFKYFQQYSNAIRSQEFVFQPSVLGACSQTFTDIVTGFRRTAVEQTTQAHQCQIVGVHVRRGDMTSKSLKDLGFIPANASYIIRAMEYYRKRMSNECVRFLIIGNDHQWTSKNIPDTSDVKLRRSSRDPAMDLCLLAHCHHMIVTVGTFGWWAAWLANGHVTYQAEYAVPDSYLGRQFEPADYFPAHWVPL